MVGSRRRRPWPGPSGRPGKQPPAPVRTATDRSVSPSNSRKTSASRWAVGPSTAFFTSGRLMTTVRTLPSRWTFTVGCSAISSIFRRLLASRSAVPLAGRVRHALVLAIVAALAATGLAACSKPSLYIVSLRGTQGRGHYAYPCRHDELAGRRALGLPRGQRRGSLAACRWVGHLCRWSLPDRRGWWGLARVPKRRLLAKGGSGHACASKV
jgi:hypothetical protein